MKVFIVRENGEIETAETVTEFESRVKSGDIEIDETDLVIAGTAINVRKVEREPVFKFDREPLKRVKPKVADAP